MDALQRVEIVTEIGERGSFRLSFLLKQNSTLPERFFLESADLIRVVMVVDEAGGPSVLMDGVMVEHAVSTRTDDEPAMLVISGQDLTLKMDLVEQVRPFSAMPIHTRIQVILAGYGALGIVPSVVPPPIVETPIPTERIPNQVGTDYAYMRSLAAIVGHRFTLDPGPAPGSSVAYWGPEPRGDRAQPSLVIDFEHPQDVTALQLRFDAAHRVVPEALVLEPSSKALIPIPVPDIAALNPPLGATLPPAHRHRRLHSTAKQTPGETAGALLAVAARSAEAMTGRGVLHVSRDRASLRAGSIVQVRGSAKPFEGLFAVSRVRHVITSHRHDQEFELVRAGIGAQAPRGES
jgi:hypothetical protein